MKYVATLNDHRGQGSSLSLAVVDLFGKVAEDGSHEEFDHLAKSLLALARASGDYGIAVTPRLLEVAEIVRRRGRGRVAES